MDSSGRLFPKGQPKRRARLYASYEELAGRGFDGLDRFSDEELDWLQGIHDRHLDFLREERRMHFGAFALVAVVFIILLPATLYLEDYFLVLAAVEALLLVLLVPYTFVYRKYEEGVRLRMRQAVLLENERRMRSERGEEGAAKETT